MATPPYLICEGPAGGLDVRVLDRIIAKKLGKIVTIEPAGGNRGLGSVASYIEMRYSAPAYSIEDRDYRPQDEVEASWAKPGGKSFVWQRHEIENYLLDPRVVADAFTSLQTTARGAWLAALPTTRQSVDAVMRGLAGSMIEQHAGWITFERLRKHMNALNIQITGPTAKPPGREEWLNYFAAECSRVKSACRTFVGTSGFEDADVLTLYDEILAEIRQPDFYSSGRYLVEMAGKELMSALSQQVVPKLSRPDLHKELIDAFERQYVPGFFNPDDFSELANRLL